MLERLEKITGTKWKRINMRQVEHLPAVELIHDLYNQYDFTINHIRFKNTVTFWKDGMVNSYAPEYEWENIAHYLGDKFFNLDAILINELNRLYDSNRVFFETYLKSIDLDKLSELSDTDLKNTLINIQNFALGDLYRLNFVQVEHALTTAINKELKRLGKEPGALSALIVSDKHTEYQYEEIAFHKLVKKLKGANQTEIEKLVRDHWEKFAFMHCAYGESPYPVEYYLERVKNYSNDVIGSELDLQAAAKASKELLSSIESPVLKELIPLMIRGGEFRDNNKARLGQTMKYKFAVLDEISRRSGVNRSDISFYSVKELCELIETGTKLDDSVVVKRRGDGVLLVRFEGISKYPEFSMSGYQQGVSDLVKGIQSSGGESKKELSGACASPGVVSGVAKIVYSYEDGEKVKEGDIMVAIGTDFDLMDAIQRSSAVITEEGGLLSHASVVCRELKKPCCIAVENATTIIKDGQKIHLDAEKGLIKIQES